MTQRRAIAWQHPFAALLDAVRPGGGEEVIYRFTAWGLLWLLLRRSLPQVASVAGLLTLLIHTYTYFDAFLAEAPLVALSLSTALTAAVGVVIWLVAGALLWIGVRTFHRSEIIARY